MNSDTYSDDTSGGTIYNLTKHLVYNEYLTPFYQTTVSSLKNNHLRSNVINFVLGYILIFDTIIENMKQNHMDEITSLPKWELKNVFRSLFIK